MYQLFSTQELLQGIPDLTLLTLTHQQPGYRINLYPSNHADAEKLSSYRHAKNRYQPLNPKSKRTKTIPFTELLDDFLLETTPAQRKTAYDETVAQATQMSALNPLYTGDNRGLYLHWLLQYATTHSISYHTFYSCIQQPRSLSTPPAFQAAGAPALLEALLITEWELCSSTPKMHYLLRNPATNREWRKIPVTVKIEATNRPTPTTGTLQLGYGTDCPGSAIHLQDEILQWLQQELDGTPIFYNNTQSSPLRISIPTP